MGVVSIEGYGDGSPQEVQGQNPGRGSGELNHFIIYETLFMTALCNRAGHYIFALWFVSSSSLFPRLISAVGD